MRITHSDTLLPARGDLRIRVKDILGHTLSEQAGDNLILIPLKEVLAFLVSDASRSDKVITTVGVGTSSLTPTPDDTELENVYPKEINSFTYPVPGKVTFLFTLGHSEANGLTIVEYGLFTAAGDMVTRRVKDPVVKHDGIVVEGEWTLTF